MNFSRRRVRENANALHQRAYGFRLVNERRVSEHAAVNDRMRRIVSMALLLAALGMFVAFHFLPPTKSYQSATSPQAGWVLWSDLFQLLRHPELFIPRGGKGVTVSSFFMSSFLIFTTPFLSNIWPRSRFAWCFVTVFSGLAAAGFVAGSIDKIRGGSMLLGGWFLIISPYLNFLGLLLARRWRDEPRISPIPPPDSP